MSNEPLYPFGYGLSYTKFVYSDIRISKNSIRAAEKLKVSVTVSNEGDYDGEEVVQLYIRDVTASVNRPLKELKGFQKIFLKKGATQEVVFTISTDDLKFYDRNMQYAWEPGEFRVRVGANSRDVKEAVFNVIK